MRLPGLLLCGLPLLLAAEGFRARITLVTGERLSGILTSPGGGIDWYSYRYDFVDAQGRHDNFKLTEEGRSGLHGSVALAELARLERLRIPLPSGRRAIAEIDGQEVEGEVYHRYRIVLRNGRELSVGDLDTLRNPTVTIDTGRERRQIYVSQIAELSLAAPMEKPAATGQAKVRGEREEKPRREEGIVRESPPPSPLPAVRTNRSAFPQSQLCEFCGREIPAGQERCGHCGAARTVEEGSTGWLHRNAERVALGILLAGAGGIYLLVRFGRRRTRRKR
jgi:hypothetical protein